LESGDTGAKDSSDDVISRGVVKREVEWCFGESFVVIRSVVLEMEEIVGKGAKSGGMDENDDDTTISCGIIVREVCWYYGVIVRVIREGLKAGQRMRREQKV
jgi:hypothetical protein